MKIWDLTSESEMYSYSAHADTVFDVAFSRDGSTLISAGGRDIKFWDLATGKQRFTLRGHRKDVSCIAVSHDERLLVSGSWDKTIRLWRAASPKEVDSSEWWQAALKD